MYFWYYLQFCILTLKSSQAKIGNIYFSTRNLYILDENTSKYRQIWSAIQGDEYYC